MEGKIMSMIVSRAPSSELSKKQSPPSAGKTPAAANNAATTSTPARTPESVNAAGPSKDG